MKSLLSNIYKNKKLLLVSLFLLSLLVSGLFFFFLGKVGPAGHQEPNTDYVRCYKPFAENLLQGKGMLVEGGKIDCSLGYPVILAPILVLSQFLGIEDELKIIIPFNSLLIALAVVFLFLFTELIFNKRIALIASLLWMTYPFSLWFLKNPHTEAPFILFIYIGIWLYFLSLRKKDFMLFFLTGIILGLAVLIKPIGSFLPFLFAPLVFLFSPTKKQIFSALLILGGFILVVLPFSIVASLKTQELTYLYTRGNEPLVGFTYALRQVDGSGWPKTPSDVLSLMEEIGVKNITTNTGLFTFILARLEDKPAAVLKLITLKMARSWYATGQMWWEDKIFLVQAPYLLTALLGIFYGIKAHREKIKNIIFLLAIIFCFWGITTIVAVSIMRYMIPAMGIMMIFSAILIDLVIASLAKRYARG